jgi:hypothetical protein
MPMPDQRDQDAGDLVRARETVYQEICKSHASIADFRARLLALLPAASGASVFIALQKADGDNHFLGPLGLFGFTAIFGLFMYELRGIEDCVKLRRHAEAIEHELGIREGESHFHRKRGKLGGLADEIGAGWIVYTAVLISWLYVAGRGFHLDRWLGWNGRVLEVLLVILYVGLLVVAFSPRSKLAERLAGIDPFREGDSVLVFRERDEGTVESVTGGCATVRLLGESDMIVVPVDDLRVNTRDSNVDRSAQPR